MNDINRQITNNVSDGYTLNTQKSVVNNINNVNNTTSSSNKSNVNSTNSDTDTIQINETNQNVINGKKAKDALDYTLKDCSQYEKADMLHELYRVQYVMETEGYETPSSVTSLDQSFSFGNYADNLIKCVTKLNETSPGFVSSDFLDFCESYKNNLKNFGCD